VCGGGGEQSASKRICHPRALVGCGVDDDEVAENSSAKVTLSDSPYRNRYAWVSTNVTG